MGLVAAIIIFLINEFMCLALKTQMTILIFHYNETFGFSRGKLLYIYTIKLMDISFISPSIIL